MRAATGGMFVRIRRWASPLALAAVLATGCSSEEQPGGVTDNSGSGGSGGTTGANPAGMGGTGGGISVPPGDGGTGPFDQPNCGGPYVLMQVSGDSSADACKFTFTVTPPDPYNIRVITAPPPITIPPSASDGWSYTDPTFSEIVLLGSYCDALLAGNITGLYALNGCNTGIP